MIGKFISFCNKLVIDRDPNDFFNQKNQLFKILIKINDLWIARKKGSKSFFSANLLIICMYLYRF